ncbi:MAG: DNA primase [Pseudomonadota bacterium]
MRFSQDFLQSLREKVPLSELVGRAVTWDRRKSQPGRGDYWACCPFHQEKTPSFHVDDRKGYYHCFGCHASGDHIAFLTDHSGLDFKDAVTTLADMAGVALPKEPSRESGRDRARNGARAALDGAATYYSAQFWGRAGHGAQDYAAGRGFDAAVARQFGFGLAPPVGGVRTAVSDGVTAEDLLAAGLTVERDGRTVERFRGRLMVPIHDGRGKVVGFGGRTLDGRDPKYLNSPQTILFDKSRLLYNAHRARGPAHRANRLFVVEGYLDAVALHAAGLEMVVASLGTALTEQQIALAWQMADEPVLCFDGDAAGRTAAARALPRIIPHLGPGKSFQILTLPAGKDPDDVVRAGGRAAFEELAKGAVPLVDAIFEVECAAGAETPERMAALEGRLNALADAIADKRTSALYTRAFREKLFALRRVVTTGAPKKPAAQAVQRPPEDPTLELERLVLGLGLWSPPLLDVLGERLASIAFSSEVHQQFAHMMLETYAAHLPETRGALLAALPAGARLCLREVWGDGGELGGPRLVQRHPILAHDPPESFVASSMDVFLLKLDARKRADAVAEARTGMLAGDPEAERRFMALKSSHAAEAGMLDELERALADEATAIRRGKPTSPGAPTRNRP